MIKKLLTLIVVCSLWIPLGCETSNVYGAIYYVKNGGDNSKDGLSDANAWETMSKVRAFSFTAGDTISLNRGDTWASSLDTISSGTAGNPITFTSYGTGDKPRVQLIFFNDNDYITLSNLHAQAVSPSHAMNMTGDLSNFIIEDCLFDGNGTSVYTVQIRGTSPTAMAKDIVMKDCEVKNEGGGGSGNITVGAWTDNVIVQDNTVYGADDNNIQAFNSQGRGVNVAYAPTNITISGNTCYGATQHGIELGWDLTNSIVERNFCYSNANGGIVSAESNNNIIRNNILYDNLLNMTSLSSSHDNQWLNNTLVGGATTTRGMWFQSNIGTGSIFKNNISTGTNLSYPELKIDGTVEVETDYNDFYDSNGIRIEYHGTTYNSLATYQAASSQDANSLNADPLLDTDYTLKSGSPAVDAGATLTDVTDDYAEVTRTTPYDIGAYKYAAHTYYVKTGGDDSNDGQSDANAWATIAKVNAQTFSPGDIILFNQGDTWVTGSGDDSSLQPDSGTVAGYITYSQYGTGTKPLINVDSTYQMGLYAFQKEYFIIDNFQFSGGQDEGRLIFLDSSNNVKITNCDFTSITPEYAIYSYHDGSPAVDVFEILIDGCTFTTVSENNAIRFGVFSNTNTTRNITITNNTFTDLPGGAIRFFIQQAQTDNGQAPRDILIDNNTMNDVDTVAILIDSAIRLTVTNNDCTDIGDPGIANINAFQINNVKGGLIEGNTITGVDTSAPDGHAIILDWGYTSDNHLTENVTVSRNKLSGCLAGSGTSGVEIFKAKNCTVKNNIVFNCNRGMQLVSAVSEGNVFYNNTVSITTNYCFTARSSAPACILNNNIFSGGTYGVRVESSAVNPTENYNSFFNNSTYKYYNADTTSEVAIGANSITGDPLLDSNYRLKSGSPAIDSGADVGMGNDYYGNIRRSPFEIGAVEYCTSLKNCVIFGAIIE